MSARDEAVPMVARWPAHRADVPTCSVCTEVLGTHGGPCSLPCGHNGCFHCLKEVQARNPVCPLCRTTFSPVYEFRPNPVLQQLVTSAAFGAGGAEEDGWEAVPSRAHAIRMYAHDLAGNLASPPPPASTSSASATDASSAPGASPRGESTQLVVRQAAAQHIASPRGGPLAILLGSYHANARSEPRYSYESILSWVPPQWMPDSCAPACKACCMPFVAVVRLRHHCRLCGLIFCHTCSSQKLLLPPKFGYREPQRVCDRCFEVLKPADLQNALAGHFSKAAQSPVHDVTDWTSMRAWLNNPLTSSLEQDIYKCSNILGHFVSSSRLHAERAIPAALLQNAAGYAILSVLKVGCGWSAAVGTGLVVARMADGSWSPPSAVGLGSFGWGLQAGGELADLLLVLSDTETVKAFCGDVHLGVAGNVNVTVGPVGRDASASVTCGRRGYAMVYSYSCSRGAFLGVSIDGTVTHTRSNANLAFYGRPLTAKDLLLGGTVEAPPAARTLYAALDSMMNSFGYSQLPGRAQVVQHAAALGARVPLDATFSVDDFGAPEKAPAAAEPPTALGASTSASAAAAVVDEEEDGGMADLFGGEAELLPAPPPSAPLIVELPREAGAAADPPSAFPLGRSVQSIAPAAEADAASEMSDEVPYSLFD